MRLASRLTRILQLPHRITPEPALARPSRERSSARVLGLYAVTLALVASVVYIATAAIRIYLVGIFSNVSRDVLWMSPVSNLLWYGATWVVLVAATRHLGGRGTEVGLWALVAVFGFSRLLPITAIHRVAALVLAAGIATAAVRVHRRSPDFWYGQACRLRNALIVLLLALNALPPAASAFARLRRPAGISRASAPDVILLVLDTMRGDVVQPGNSPGGVMPFLDSLASTGTYFPYAVATTSWTLPSHGSLFTGEYPGALNTTILEPLATSHYTLGEAFAGAGYYTTGFTGNLHYTSWESGINQGFREWHDYRRSLKQLLRSSLIGQVQMIVELSDARTREEVIAALRRHQIMVYPKPEPDAPTASEITERFLDWHGARPGQPFFAFINYFDAHFPYDPPMPYRSRFEGDGLGEQHDLYEGELAYVDEQLRRLFAELTRRGVLRNTVVVITGDHGEHFGAHGQYQHGRSLYNVAIRVPLIILGPGVPARRIEKAVSLRDVPATIAHLAGLTARFPGKSLTGYFADSSYRSSPALASLGDGPDMWRSYMDDRYHLVVSPEGTQLYRYRSDPREQIDLANIDTLKPELARLRTELATAIAQAAMTAPPP